MEIRVADLTEEALKGIGHMITPRTWSPPRPGDEHSYADTRDDLGLPAPCSSGVVECAPRPRVIRRMERHVRTPEVLVCLDGEAVVCLAGPQESAAGALKDIRALKVRPGQGFVLDTGAWHAIPFPSGSAPARFLVIFRSGTGRDDLQFCDFAASPVVTG